MIDGLAKPEDMVRRAKKLGQPAIALTDHGVLSSVPEFYKAAKKAGVQPVIGLEAYIVPDAKATGFGAKGNLRDRTNSHLTLMAINEQGYKDLVKLSTWSHTPETFYYKPRIDYNVLREVGTENLVCLSGCVLGELAKSFLNIIRPVVAVNLGDGTKKADWVWPVWTPKLDQKLRKAPEFAEAVAIARGMLKRYRGMFPDGQYFYEVMDHDYPPETWVHIYLIPEAERYGIPVVVTNDAHYAPTSHKMLHDVLMSIGSKEVFCGQPDTKRLDLCSAKELAQRVEHLLPGKKFVEAAENTLAIADMARGFKITPLDKPRVTTAKYKDDDGVEERHPERKIREISEPRLKMLCERYPDKADVYRTRFQDELSIIKRFRYLHFFLIAWDYINMAKTNGMLVGAGRGSGAGSLVAYCMRITEIDPIRHGLLFERFLNPERASAPDFDTDFASSDGPLVMQYISEKYGGEYVSRVCAYDRMRAKTIIKSLFEAFGLMTFHELNIVTKELDDAIGEKDGSFLPGWWAKAREDKRIARALDSCQYPLEEYSEVLYGVPTSVSSHAAAVLITDHRRPLREWIPLQYIASSKSIVTQYDMDQLEEFGLVKNDVLFLGTLDTLKLTYENIGFNPFEREVEREGVMLYDDEATYKMISEGKTDGMFQLSGGTAKQVIGQIAGCHTFEDIIAVMSLGRPGAVRFATKYRNNRLANWDDVRLAHPDLKEILRHSYGVVLFQEDVMNIVWHLGVPSSELETIMHAIKKKDATEFAKVEESFIQHALDKGWTQAQAANVWDQIRDYAGYSFNKSHATCYADLAYQTAYLKTHYPAYFIAAKMRQFSLSGNRELKMEKMPALLRDARRQGITVLPPSVNKSGTHYMALSESKIRVGLADITGVGLTAAKEIIAKRPFKASDFNPAYEDVGPRGGHRKHGATLTGVSSKCNSGALMAMAYAGAMPGIDVENIWEAERELLACSVSPHPNQEVYQHLIEQVDTSANLEVVAPDSPDPDHEGLGFAGGVITRYHEHRYTPKRGGPSERMAFLTLELGDLDFSVVVFADIWSDIRGRVEEGRLMLARVKAEHTKKYGFGLVTTKVDIW